jgi:hypothetical protein
MLSTCDHGSPGFRALRSISYKYVVILVSALLAGAAMFGQSVGSGTLVASADVDTPQRGFALPTWQVDGYDGLGIGQSMSEMKELGANWVQLTPTWWQLDRYTSDIIRAVGTVSDTGLERAIKLAHQHGLKVFLKPHVDLPHNLRDSRNNIRPHDRGAWFNSYTAFITHYAEMAQQLGVEQFAVATELTGVTDDRTAWLNIIQAVRDRYAGPLVYAAGDNWLNVPFWDAVDVIGVDAYLQLGTAPTTDVQALKRAWESVLGDAVALSAQYGKQILFTEAGYTSQRGTITDPSNWRVSRTPDQAEQAAAYEALLATFTGQPWWAGVYWWLWADAPDVEADPLDFSPRGKAAEAVIRRWWAG